MVYLIHIHKLDDKEPDGPKLGQRVLHYVGFVKEDKDLEKRISEHRAGYDNGSKLLKAANEKNVSWEVVAIYPGENENFERKMKLTNKLSRYCPICNPDSYVKTPFARKLKVPYQEMWERYYEQKFTIVDMNDPQTKKIIEEKIKSIESKPKTGEKFPGFTKPKR